MSSRFFYHAVDFTLVETGRRRNGNFLFLTCAEVLCRYIDNAVGIDIEGNFDARYSTGSRRNTGQFETAQRLVVCGHFTFALQDMNINGRLVIHSCREDLFAFRRDGRVAFNNLREDTAHSFNTERQGSNIEKQYILNIAYENSCLNSRTDSYAFIGVNALIRVFSKNIFNSFLNSRNAAGTADEDNFINFIDGKTRIFNSLASRFHRSVYEVCRQFIEFSPRQRKIQVFRTAGICCNERQINVCRHNSGQFNFCFFSRIFQALFGHLIL